MSDRDRLNVLQMRVAELERKLEFVMRHVGVQYTEDPLAPALAEAAKALARGNKLEAITVYRQATGCGLKEAKDAVDALEARLGGG